MPLSPTPRDSPMTGGSPEALSVVACIGDSLTQGTMSAHYVAMLGSRPALARYRLSTPVSTETWCGTSRPGSTR